MSELTHIDRDGNVKMVDVSDKQVTKRVAKASCKIFMANQTLLKIIQKNMPKGDVLACARIAGIMAAKNTQNLIPMCHQIPLDGVEITFTENLNDSCIEITSIVKCFWKTGVEMEALTAVSVSALTIYDMCKAVDKEMVISGIQLIEKTGGRSGESSEKGA